MSSSANNGGRRRSTDFTPDYKAKLDEIASKAKNPPAENEGTGLVDKISQYVPAVGKVLGGEANEPESSAAKTDPSVPPQRPEHDTQIEEFLRDQHRSHEVVGANETGSN
ncbi:hypothetical protein MMYC01_204212 [Madurella mycetomatis]|uniref:Uncharacterized protein n=1 Tax=Madurella mycetomatis TaxID=100816 RepID=A0A175W2T1_9PEZI|nr:hypothetical protein MMYC01_204212 [Madurella mycetomatis]